MHDNCNCCGEGRRQVLRAMLGMASVPLVAAAARPAMAAQTAQTAQAVRPARLTPISGAGRIDTHAHLWPVEYLDFVESAGHQTTAVARNIRATASPEDLSARFAMMDKAGVSKQVLSATPQLVQTEDAAACRTGARMINDAYAKLVENHPDRFMAYGAVPLPHVDEAVVEARRCMTELGFLGIAVNTLTANTTLAREDYHPFYAELDRLGAVLYIHPTGCGAQSPMINDFRLEWVVGAPFEDSLAVLQLLKADIPHKYPNIKIHVAHLGGALGFLMQRIEDNYAHWKAFPRSPTEELKKMWFDTANFHAPALRCMIDTFGSDKLILGSDFPYFQDELYTRIVTYIEDAGLPAPVSQAILTDNAHRLYGQAVRT